MRLPKSYIGTGGNITNAAAQFPSVLWTYIVACLCVVCYIAYRIVTVGEVFLQALPVGIYNMVADTGASDLWRFERLICLVTMLTGVRI